MIIPSYNTSSFSILNDNNQPCSYTLQIERNFLDSRCLEETCNHNNNSNTKVNKNLISFIKQEFTIQNEQKNIMSQTKCKNVLISDSHYNDHELLSIPIKRNKFHNEVFNNNHGLPVNIQMTNILKKIYPLETQSCFITIEHDKINNFSPNLSKIASNNSKDELILNIKNNSSLEIPKNNQQNAIKIPSQHILKQPSKDSNQIYKYQKIMNDSKTIKSRQNFTKEQRTILNNYLLTHRNNPYAGSNDVAQLSEMTGLQPRQIRIYFTNKRMRDAKCMDLATTKRCKEIFNDN